MTNEYEYEWLRVNTNIYKWIQTNANEYELIKGMKLNAGQIMNYSVICIEGCLLFL